MATELPISELSGDLRSPAVDQQRIKEASNRRVKYRNVNLNLIGEATGWTDKNKYKMDREASRPASSVVCYCSGCQRENRGRGSNKKRRASQKTLINEEICMVRKYPQTPAAEERCSWDDSSDNDSIYGVTYSFDHPTGPTAGTDALNYAVTEAVKKFENKELATLIKNEYEIVDSNDSDSDDFELI